MLSVFQHRLYSIFTPLLIFGIVLAYYLPAIPFILWISAIAGWVILIVESLIAAPLWLCAHALPEGEGAAGQHGKRGYLLFLAILIRPPLMVAGFFAAVILMNIMGKLIGESFQLFAAGVGQIKVIGPIGTISMIVILGLVIIMLTNKFFSLIHYLPEHVTNWIGQQFHSLGEKEDQAGAKGAFVSSTNADSTGANAASRQRKGYQHNPAESSGEGATQPSASIYGAEELSQGSTQGPLALPASSGNSLGSGSQSISEKNLA